MYFGIVLICFHYSRIYEKNWFDKNSLHCGMELITCPSCSIQLTIISLNISQLCTDKNVVNKTSTSSCPCGALTIWEPSNNYPMVNLCSIDQENIFTSSTRSVGISFNLHPDSWTSSFSLSFVAQRNQDTISGLINQKGFITSPNFPSLYPRDFGVEHILTCASETCIICVIFTDFLVSTTSIMELYDWNGRSLQVVTGQITRPGPIISSGPSLSIRFFGNGGTALGYKAIYYFTKNTTAIRNVNTECGGEVDDIGGTIFMTGLSGLYDCIWIILSTTSISHFKTHIYLKVIEYPQGNLTLRSGFTSESRLIEKYSENHIDSVEHVTPINKGFYVSFKGNLNSESKLLISYATFKYLDCLSGIDFLCNNKRCISNQLVCDSVDSCGDNSDESNCEPENIQKPRLQYWWPLRSNGFSPSSGPAGALLTFGVALTGAAILLAVALCRVAVRVRSPPPSYQNHHMDHVRTIAHLLSIGDIDDRDDPPIYEPPPEYNQCVKPATSRRNQSTKRLIKKETSQCQPEDTSFPSTSEVVERTKQFLDVPSTSAPDIFSNAVVKIPQDSTPPVSLDPTDYAEDLGFSLSLSTSSQRGISAIQNPQWCSSTSDQVLCEITPSLNKSILSFETLYSSADNSLISVPRLTKSYSQDNMLNYSSNSKTSMIKEYTPPFHKHGEIKLSQNGDLPHSASRKSLNDNLSANPTINER